MPIEPIIDGVPPPQPARLVNRNRFNFDDFPNLRAEFQTVKEVYPHTKLFPVGSYETTGGAFRDIDILCQTAEETAQVFLNFLLEGDWERDNNNPYNHMPFISLRAVFDGTPFNLLVTHEEDFVIKFLRGATLCKHLQLNNKDQRILVHEMFYRGLLEQNIQEIEV